jgi:hypothetical protein
MQTVILDDILRLSERPVSLKEECADGRRLFLADLVRRRRWDAWG